MREKTGIERLVTFLFDNEDALQSVEAEQAARMCILDEIGCGIYGSRTQEGRRIIKAAADLGSCGEIPVWGTGHLFAEDTAAMVNGALCHIRELDDVHYAILHTESTAREKAIKYMLERDATYQKAISEGYSVTDEEVWAYLDELKEIINGATNKDEAQALINQFDSEEEYWQHEFEVYKINLPIEKYLNSVKQDYLNNAATIYSESEHETEHLNSCNEYLQNLQSDLAEKEDYEIME